MPKRPCAISLTPENTHILCGDKFGDVYALPLHPPASDSEPKHGTDVKPAPKAFKPAANELTIHSGRNRRALESQIKQGQTSKPKETIDFAHELLLGHVSMLTDLASATIKTDKGNTRRYIITADRDEHIRVSRGMPQAHIIETFCMGHKSFVNKMCLPSPTILVSGGGDDELYVWDWQHGALLFKLDLRKPLEDFWNTQPKHSRHDEITEQLKADDEEMLLQDSREAMGVSTEADSHGALLDESKGPTSSPAETIAVSGLWPNHAKAGVVFYCALEGVPVVFEFAATSATPRSAEEITLRAIPLSGNPLDVAVLSDGTPIIAVDNVHEAGSTKLTASTDSVRL